MNKVLINYIVDVLLFISFILVFITGLFKWPGLLKGLGLEAMKGAALNGIHDWSGLAMGILVLIHLVLHWDWIVAMTKKYLGIKK